MEDMPNDLQDTILTVHHTYMHTFGYTPAIKIVENHNGSAMVNLRTLNKNQQNIS